MRNTLSELQIQQMAQLVYLDILDSAGNMTPLSKIYDEEKSITIGQLINYYTTLDETDPEYTKFKERFSGSINGVDEDKKMLEFLESLRLYSDWKISNIKSNNKKNESGFVAYTIEPEPGKILVTFRGSEPIDNVNYFNDWQNNLSTTFKPESLQQWEAQQYIKEYIEPMIIDGSIDELYLTGHSLGGNLALYSSFILSDELRQKLITATTFNAPGFNSKTLAYYQNEIQEMIWSGKLTEFQNRYDIVPAFMLNPSKGILIDTKYDSNNPIDHHSMFFLKQNDGKFVRSDSQTREIHILFIHKLSMQFESLSDFMKSRLIQLITDRMENKKFELADLPKIWATAEIIKAFPGMVIKALTATMVEEAKRKIDLFVQRLKEKAIQKSIEFVVAVIHTKQKFDQFKEDLKNKIVQKGVQFIVSAVKAKQAFDRFKQDLQNKALKKGVEFAVAILKAKQQFDHFKSELKNKAKKKVDSFISKVNTFRANMNQLKNDLRKKAHQTFKSMIQGSAKAARGPRIKVNINQLDGLYRSVQRSGESISQQVRQILSTVNRLNAVVGREYSEWYVQSQIRQIDHLLEQIRKEEKVINENMRAQAIGLRQSIQKYKEVEVQLSRLNRMQLRSL